MIILSFSAPNLLMSSITSSSTVVSSVAIGNDRSIASVRGFVEIVGINLKCVIQCLSRSMGKSLNTPFKSIDASSSIPVICCRLMNTAGRSSPFTAFLTRLDFPNRLGLMSTRWFGPSIVRLISSSSTVRSVKYSFPTIVPNLNGLFML